MDAIDQYVLSPSDTIKFEFTSW